MAKTSYCNYCDAWVVAHFVGGDLIRVYVQHRHTIRQCAGTQQQLDIAGWLPEISRVDVELKEEHARASGTRRTRMDGADRTQPIRPYINPRADRTADGRTRKR